MKCDELKAYVAGFDGILHENKRHGDVYLKDDVNEAIAELKSENRRLKHSLWKLKALYFYRMFQWSIEGKRLAPEDDEPEDFFMECMGKHTKRKSEWGKEADMFDNARIVCIKKLEEYNV